MASAHELRKLLNAKRSVHEDTFKDITQQCLRMIMRHSSTRNIDRILFRVPRYVFGKAIYDFEECKNYVTKSLKDLGYLVFPHDGESIQISWQSNTKADKLTRTEDWITNQVPMATNNAGVEYKRYDSKSPTEETRYPLGTMIRMPSRVAMRTDASWHDKSR